jgi:hypothetical protein
MVGMVGAAGVAFSSRACTIVEFGAENLLNPGQNTPQITFGEIAAFAAGHFPTRPIFSGDEPRFNTGLNMPIDLTGLGYAAVHYAPGTSGDPTFNRGGSLVFYYIGPGRDPCLFTFPQRGPGNKFSNGSITSVILFSSEPVPDTGTTAMLFAIALGVLTLPRLRRPRGYAT